MIAGDAARCGVHQLFKLGNSVCRNTGISPMFFGHRQDACATSAGKLIGHTARWHPLFPAIPVCYAKVLAGISYHRVPLLGTARAADYALHCFCDAVEHHWSIFARWEMRVNGQIEKPE
jgi:hypothetical protein